MTKSGYTIPASGESKDMLTDQNRDNGLRIAGIQQYMISMIEGALTPTMLFNAQGQLMLASKSMDRLWSVDVLKDISSYNIFADEQLRDAGIMPLIMQAFEGKVPESVEIYYDPALLNNPGRDRWIKASAYPVYSENNQVDFVIVLMEDITDRKQAERNADQYLGIMKNFMDSVTDALVIYDNELNFIEINKVALAQSNKRREDVVGKNIKDIVPGIEKTLRYQKYLDVIKTGLPFEEEVDDHPFAPGKTLLIKAYKTINGMGITTSDITVSRNALKRELRQRRELEILRESAMDFVELSHDEDLFSITAKKLSTICNNSPVIITMVDPKTKRVIVRGIAGKEDHSQIVKELVGGSLSGSSFPYYRYDDLLYTGKLERITQSLYDITGGELHESVCKLIEERLKIKKIYTIGFTRKGNLYGNALILVSNKNLKLKTHLIEAFIHQLSIAIYRFRSEKAYRESEKRFEAAFGTSPDAVNITRMEDGMYIDINDGFTDITGYTRDDIIGYTSIEKNIWANPADRKFLVEELKNKGFVKNMEAKFNTLQGEQKVGLMSANKFSKDGINYIISITRDITERVEYQEKLKEAREKAEESDRLKTAFLANISHEVRTPMNAILGFTDMLMNSNSPDDRKQEYIRLINKSSHNLLSIINDIIDFSMIETGQLQIYPGECAVNTILEDLYATFEQFRKMEAKDHLELKLIELLDEENNNIECDEERIKQVMTNILGNAIKYTEQGSIQFGCKLIKDKENRAMLEFFVKDTGIGIPRSKHELIFERFRQLDDSNTRKYGGNGLGLSISKQIANLLDGDIRLDSKPGKGSTFYFSIPFRPSTQPIQNEQKEEHQMDYNWENHTILVAEDVMSNFFLIKSMLEYTNINISWARNGEEAIKLMGADIPFDLILMDVRMPIMNGYEATREIRKMNSSIPIIALSANALQRDIDISLENGCNDHITKPVRKEALISGIARFLQ